MTELEKNSRALVSRRMARACAEVLGEHLMEERARQLVFEIGKARVLVESLEGPGRLTLGRRVRRPRLVDMGVV